MTINVKGLKKLTILNYNITKKLQKIIIARTGKLDTITSGTFTVLLYYVNDLLECVYNKIKLYAGDVLLYSVICSKADYLQLFTGRLKFVISMVCFIANRF